jgi:hypothetical protein
VRLADITRVVFVVVVAPPLNEHEDSENNDDLMRRAFNPVKEADILSDEEAQVFFVWRDSNKNEGRRYTTPPKDQMTKNDKKPTTGRQAGTCNIFFLLSS